MIESYLITHNLARNIQDKEWSCQLCTILKGDVVVYVSRYICVYTITAHYIGVYTHIYMCEVLTVHSLAILLSPLAINDVITMT